MADRIVDDNEEEILAAWRDSAEPWTRAVREGRIASRVEVTDAAIVEGVLGCRPKTVLDIGCGEGWLARALSVHGIAVTGVDAMASLVDAATREGGGRFLCKTYAELAEWRAEPRFDLAVCNFSLLGDTSVESVFAGVHHWLAPNGSLVVQTLHPIVACGDLPYRDGWREGSWARFGPEFRRPAPWYFRTIENWTALFSGADMRLVRILEPRHPHTSEVVSLILEGTYSNSASYD